MKRKWHYKIYYTYKDSDIKIILLTAAYNKKEAIKEFNEWNKEHNNNCVLVDIVRASLAPIEISGYYEVKK